MANSADRSRAKIWLWLLILPLIALTCVPTYNKVEPQLFDFPFFYWYQLLWVVIGAAIMALVYVKTRHCWTSDKEGGQQ
jgi:cell division protein FtsW (lipid II flippase)